MSKLTPQTADALIFDLDDTLYPHGGCLDSQTFWGLFNGYVAQLNDLSVEDVAATTAALRAKNRVETCEVNVIDYWRKNAVFDLTGFTELMDAQDISHMQPCAVTNDFLARMPGRKVIFTNAHRTHAERVLAHLEMAHHFEHVCDFITRGERLKPDPTIYEELVTRLGLDPTRCIMFEDRADNLRPAHNMGMTTVLVHPEVVPPLEHVHSYAPSLRHWIQTHAANAA